MMSSMAEGRSFRPRLSEVKPSAFLSILALGLGLFCCGVCGVSSDMVWSAYLEGRGVWEVGGRVARPQMSRFFMDSACASM